MPLEKWIFSIDVVLIDNCRLYAAHLRRKLHVCAYYTIFVECRLELLLDQYAPTVRASTTLAYYFPFQ